MYQYSKKPKSWDWKAITAGIGLGVVLVTMSSWVEVAVEHATDFHFESPSQDWQGQLEAQESSKHNDSGYSSYTDRDGSVHTYENGKENC